MAGNKTKAKSGSRRRHAVQWVSDGVTAKLPLVNAGKITASRCAANFAFRRHTPLGFSVFPRGAL